MEDLLAGKFFRHFIFPIGSAFLLVWVRYVTRNDQYRKFIKEDFAVGLDLILTACLMYLLLTTERALALTRILSMKPIDEEQARLLSGVLAEAGWVILLMFLGLWGTSTIVRKWGWESESVMRSFVGIGIPLAVGLLYLFFVTSGSGR
jgi:hypothetical protein